MARMKAYRIEGTFPMGINRKQNFRKELACKDEAEATEMLLSIIGSEHGVKRRMIKIVEIKELKPDDIESPGIKKMVGVK